MATQMRDYRDILTHRLNALTSYQNLQLLTLHQVRQMFCFFTTRFHNNGKSLIERNLIITCMKRNCTKPFI